MKVGERIAVRTWRWSTLIAIVILPTVARTNLSVRLSPLDLMFILDFSGPSLTFIYDYSSHCACLGRVRFHVPGWAGAQLLQLSSRLGFLVKFKKHVAKDVKKYDINQSDCSSFFLMSSDYFFKYRFLYY